MKKRALFSLHILDRAAEFAKSLVELDWEIIASRETCNILSKEGIPVIDIADFTGIKENYGFPPTLHPRIEASLTAPTDFRIDLVYVIPYPLSVGNDIGGRTLLALAAKGNRIPVMSTQDMELVIADLKNDGQVSQDLHQQLLDKTYALISSHYDDLLRERKVYDSIMGAFQCRLLNGENPYQAPAELFSTKGNDNLSISNFKQISGDKPCFTNLADMDSIVQTMCLSSGAFKLRYSKTPNICIVAKHGNACGMGASWDSGLEAVEKALFGNPLAVWGGEAIVNFRIDDHIAAILYKSKKREEMFGEPAWMLDIVLAPHFTPEAVQIMGQRQQRKLFENAILFSPSLPVSAYAYRFVRGGFLRQPPHNFVLDFNNAELMGRELSDNIIGSLIISWSIAWSCSHGGNEIAIANNAQLLGAGGGPSTVEAAITATTRAKQYGHNLKDAVFAADAFFPFTDAAKILCDAGLKAGLLPKGGKNLALVQDFFQKKGLSIVYLPEEYRGFCRH